MPKKPQHIPRTRFARDIVAEFLPPARKSKTAKIIILCDGMPSMPKKHEILRFFSQKGYWVIHPRYRGSWESDGSFLKISPHRDVLDIINQLPRGFKDLSNNKTIKLNPSKLYVIGGSFGGPAAMMVSRNKNVDKVIARVPVVDWRDQSNTEPLAPLYDFTKQAFGQGYRMRKSDWDKLKKGTFYNPVANPRLIDPAKILIVQAQDDKIVSARTVKKFAQKNGISLIMLQSGGHLSLDVLTKPKLWPKIKKFLNS
jgi:esterase/lipase